MEDDNVIIKAVFSIKKYITIIPDGLLEGTTINYSYQFYDFINNIITYWTNLYNIRTYMYNVLDMRSLQEDVFESEEYKVRYYSFSFSPKNYMKGWIIYILNKK
jgi:hypothetical protein